MVQTALQTKVYHVIIYFLQSFVVYNVIFTLVTLSPVFLLCSYLDLSIEFLAKSAVTYFYLSMTVYEVCWPQKVVSQKQHRCLTVCNFHLICCRTVGRTCFIVPCSNYIMSDTDCYHLRGIKAAYRKLQWQKISVLMTVMLKNDRYISKQY